MVDLTSLKRDQLLDYLKQKRHSKTCPHLTGAIGTMGDEKEKMKRRESTALGGASHLRGPGPTPSDRASRALCPHLQL